MPLKVNRDEQSTINLTPLIDIVFLLIIFFMVSTRFNELTEQEKSIDLVIPSVSNASTLTAPPNSRIINVLKDGSIVLDEENVSLERLQRELVETKQQYNDIGVIVRGDAQSTHQRVCEVMAICKEAKIDNLHIPVKRVAGVPADSATR